VTKVGFSNTIWNQETESEQWDTPQSARQKKARRSKSKIKKIIIFFLIFAGYFMKNLYRLVSQWIKNIILKSRTVWERGWYDFEWKLQTIWSFELHYDNAPAHSVVSFGNFWRKSAFPSFRRFVTFTFLLVPKIKMESQGISKSKCLKPQWTK
jgi:hypothetical protein